MSWRYVNTCWSTLKARSIKALHYEPFCRFFSLHYRDTLSSSDSSDAPMRGKYRVPESLHNCLKSPHAPSVLFHLSTRTAATGCTDKNKRGRNDRNWAREKVRYHYLARAHGTDRPVQTEPLSAQLKLRESDRLVKREREQLYTNTLGWQNKR